MILLKIYIYIVDVFVNILGFKKKMRLTYDFFGRFPQVKSVKCFKIVKAVIRDFSISVDHQLVVV